MEGKGGGSEAVDTGTWGFRRLITSGLEVYELWLQSPKVSSSVHQIFFINRGLQGSALPSSADTRG